MYRVDHNLCLIDVKKIDNDWTQVLIHPVHTTVVIIGEYNRNKNNNYKILQQIQRYMKYNINIYDYRILF